MTIHPGEASGRTAVRHGAGRRWRGLAQFRRNRDGATAVEFGLVAIPFFLLLLGIFELALMFWTNQVLEEAVTRTSRLLLTGQSRTRYVDAAVNAELFKQDVCANAPGLVDCSKLTIDVRSYDTVQDGRTGQAGTQPVRNGALNTTGWGYNGPTAGGKIIVARAVLRYKLLLPSWFDWGDQDNKLINIGNGERALIATTAFRGEP